jgi:DNA repair protein RAD16
LLIDVQPRCPVCHLPLTIDLEAPALELEENVKSRQGILGRLNLENWRSSTKIEALVEELSNLKRKDATTKSIVFSQFVNFLDLVAFRLQKEGFNVSMVSTAAIFKMQMDVQQVCRLEGTMSPQARDATIQHFSEYLGEGVCKPSHQLFIVKNVHVTVFLVSLKAGGVALNLTEASTVFLMDSWWNPGLHLYDLIF